MFGPALVGPFTILDSWQLDLKAAKGPFAVSMKLQVQLITIFYETECHINDVSNIALFYDQPGN